MNKRNKSKINLNKALNIAVSTMLSGSIIFSNGAVIGNAANYKDQNEMSIINSDNAQNVLSDDSDFSSEKVFKTLNPSSMLNNLLTSSDFDDAESTDTRYGGNKPGQGQTTEFAFDIGAMKNQASFESESSQYEDGRKVTTFKIKPGAPFNIFFNSEHVNGTKQQVEFYRSIGGVTSKIQVPEPRWGSTKTDYYTFSAFDGGNSSVSDNGVRYFAETQSNGGIRRSDIIELKVDSSVSGIQVQLDTGLLSGDGTSIINNGDGSTTVDVMLGKNFTLAVDISGANPSATSFVANMTADQIRFQNTDGEDQNVDFTDLEDVISGRRVFSTQVTADSTLLSGNYRVVVLDTDGNVLAASNILKLQVEIDAANNNQFINILSRIANLDEQVQSVDGGLGKTNKKLEQVWQAVFDVNTNGAVREEEEMVDQDQNQTPGKTTKPAPMPIAPRNSSKRSIQSNSTLANNSTTLNSAVSNKNNFTRDNSNLSNKNITNTSKRNMPTQR